MDTAHGGPSAYDPTQDSGPSDVPRLLDITTLAEHLGVNTRHVRRLVAERRIPFIKCGHLIRSDPEEITAWIDNFGQHPGAARING